MLKSGYTNCACRDCFETAVSDDMANPDLCNDCEDAGCEANAETECCASGAYGGEECEGHPAGPADPMGETVYCDGSCL